MWRGRHEGPRAARLTYVKLKTRDRKRKSTEEGNKTGGTLLSSAGIKVKWGGLPLEVMLTEEGAYEGLAMFYFFDPCAQVCSFCENLSCTLITCVLF